MPRFFLVAGEPSGDVLGARLMAALREESGDEAHFEGVGGRGMAREGLGSLFPLEDIAVMGVVPVLRRLPLLLRRIRECADAVLSARPDVLVLIDSPDFCRRVARRVRAAAPAIPIVVYVSPTVWAWRPGRARAMRPTTDHLLALLPFEPAAHQKLGGPPTTYVGHPLIERQTDFRLSPREESRREQAPPRLVVLPGSRRSEVQRLMPIFGAVIGRLRQEFPDLEAVLPVVPHVWADVETGLATWPIRPHLVMDEAEKWAAFRGARAALAASGTVTLELALARVPMVVAYRLSWIEAAVGRRMVLVDTPVLPDLILGSREIPVLMQEFLTVGAASGALAPLLRGGAERERQLRMFGAVEKALAGSGQAPSTQAARTILAVMHEMNGCVRRATV